MSVVPVASVEPGQRASVVRRREGGTRKRAESCTDHGPVIPGNSDTARVLAAGNLDELEAGEIDLAPFAPKKRFCRRSDRSDTCFDLWAANDHADAAARAALRNERTGRRLGHARRWRRRQIRRRRVLVLPAATTRKVRIRRCAHRRALHPQHFPVLVEGHDPSGARDALLARAIHVLLDRNGEDNPLVASDHADSRDRVSGEALEPGESRLGITTTIRIEREVEHGPSARWKDARISAISAAKSRPQLPLG